MVLRYPSGTKIVLNLIFKPLSLHTIYRCVLYHNSFFCAYKMISRRRSLRRSRLYTVPLRYLSLGIGFAFPKIISSMSPRGFLSSSFCESCRIFSPPLQKTITYNMTADIEIFAVFCRAVKFLLRGFPTFYA